MEDNLNILANGRCPQLIAKMEDDLSLKVKGKNKPQFKVNGRRPQIVGNWKTP